MTYTQIFWGQDFYIHSNPWNNDIFLWKSWMWPRTVIYTVGVCIIRRDIMVTIVLTSNFYIFPFPKIFQHVHHLPWSKGACFLLSNFCRYFSITIIATNITNPFQILLQLPKCFLYLFQVFVTKWLVTFYMPVSTFLLQFYWNNKFLPFAEMVTESSCWCFNSAWNIMRVQIYQKIVRATTLQREMKKEGENYKTGWCKY